MKSINNLPTDLKGKYRKADGGYVLRSNGWYYEEKKGISVYADFEKPHDSNFVGNISARKLLGILSRIYQVDFKKYLPKEK